jgi:hypothetical protein
VLVCLIFCTTGVLTSIFKQIRKYACHRRDADLKRELVERGLALMRSSEFWQPRCVPQAMSAAIDPQLSK